jgi:hypothetical protein
MPRRLIVVLLFAAIIVACSSSPSPITCPTTAQSVTYAVVGSCSEAAGATMGGKITISTQPGLCSLLVSNGEKNGLPFGGQFSDTSSTGDYDITKGAWFLFEDEGNAADGMVYIRCPTTLSSDGVISLMCNSVICAADDCTGTSCSYPECNEQLTPVK